MQPVDRREEIRSALDQRNQRAHREVDAAPGEIAAEPVERRQQYELLTGTSAWRGRRAASRTGGAGIGGGSSDPWFRIAVGGWRPARNLI